MELKERFETIRSLAENAMDMPELSGKARKGLLQIITICDGELDNKTLRMKLDSIKHFRKHRVEIGLKDADTGKLYGITDLDSISDRLLDMEFVRATPETADSIMMIYLRAKE